MSYEQSTPRRYRVTWRHNRTHALHLGAVTRIDFAPHGSQVVGEDIVNHPDFIHQRGDFTVEEL